MTNPVEEKSPASKWFWIMVLVLLLAVSIYWFSDSVGETEPASPVGAAAQSTEWAQEPEGEAVPVTLPNTPLKMEKIEPERGGEETKKTE